MSNLRTGFVIETNGKKYCTSEPIMVIPVMGIICIDGILMPDTKTLPNATNVTCEITYAFNFQMTRVKAYLVTDKKEEEEDVVIVLTNKSEIKLLFGVIQFTSQCFLKFEGDSFVTVPSATTAAFNEVLAHKIHATYHYKNNVSPKSLRIEFETGTQLNVDGKTILTSNKIIVANKNGFVFDKTLALLPTKELPTDINSIKSSIFENCIFETICESVEGAILKTTDLSKAKSIKIENNPFFTVKNEYYLLGINDGSLSKYNSDKRIRYYDSVNISTGLDILTKLINRNAETQLFKNIKQRLGVDYISRIQKLLDNPRCVDPPNHFQNQQAKNDYIRVELQEIKRRLDLIEAATLGFES